MRIDRRRLHGKRIGIATRERWGNPEIEETLSRQSDAARIARESKMVYSGQCNSILSSPAFNHAPLSTAGKGWLRPTFLCAILCLHESPTQVTPSVRPRCDLFTAPEQIHQKWMLPWTHAERRKDHRRPASCLSHQSVNHRRGWLDSRDTSGRCRSWWKRRVERSSWKSLQGGESGIERK